MNDRPSPATSIGVVAAGDTEPGADGDRSRGGERPADAAGTDRSAGAVADAVAAIEGTGGVAETGRPDTIVAATPDAIVAVGESACCGLVAAGVAAPVLPVEVGGVASVARADVPTAVERLVAGDYRVREHPVVRASSRGIDGRAWMDVTLTTAETASISEYAVRSPLPSAARTRATTDDGGPSDRADPDGGDRDGDSNGGGSDDGGPDGDDDPAAGTPEEFAVRVRADGVVAATPVGSRGYARAAGGPVVVPGSGVGTVVPIAPFATDTESWVLGLDGLALSVERDGVPVEVLADDRPLGTVEPGTAVRLAPDGALELALVPESRPTGAQ
jgi:NAD+ kinase